MERACGKDRRAGVSRAVVLLAVLVTALAVAVAVPGVTGLVRQGEAVGCAAALDSAGRRIVQDYLGGNSDPTPQQVKEVAARAMLGWEDLCPGGGNVYVVAQEGEPPFRLVCGMHDGDTKLRTRLNAEYVRDQVRQALVEIKQAGEAPPEEVRVELAHRELIVRRAEEELRLSRGTAATRDYEGTVAFYREQDGELVWLGFADEHHAAVWDKDHQWSGDSYDRLV